MQIKTNKPRKPYKCLERHYTVEEVCDALRKFYGLIKPTSQYLRCSRMTIYRYLEKHPEAKKIVEDGREELLDSAETVLVKILNGGLEASTGEMLDAAKYVTSTIGKNRGYTTKTEADELLDCLSRGDTEGILHEFAELKIVMCAIKRHLPEGMAMRVWQDAVEGYAKKYSVK